MISFLQIENLTKSFGDRLLFTDVTFGINEGDKIGLIAKNGSGKTTLLRIIAGREDADSGSVTFRNGLRVAMLEQVPVFLPGATPRSAAPEFAHKIEQQMLYERLLAQLGILDLDADCGSMSGGQLKRVAMARALAFEPELVILDEPTNHLDIDAIEWLENYLRRGRISLLMVTHDRYFLDRVCNKIIEIDDGRIYSYDGNFDCYLRRRKERIDAMSAELSRVRNTLRREQQWMSRQPQARAGKARFRINNFYDLKARAQVRTDNSTVELNHAGSYIGNKIFQARNVCKSFGDKVILSDFSYDFARYDKVGIVGHNGVGKSTFVKMLIGQVSPDSGTWDVGQTVRFGYYSQEGLKFDADKKVIDAVNDIASDVTYGAERMSAMQYLNHFLFSAKDQQKFISTLSGGELRRLNLAVVLLKQPNFLILDEPTNDLDIITLGILEEYLASFKGCAIIISHDRYFLDNIVNHLFVMNGDGNIYDFPGNYTDWRHYRDEMKAASPAVSSAKGNAASSADRQSPRRPERMTFKEKHEFEALTAEIEALTAERAQLEGDFASASGDIALKSQRYEQVKLRLDEAEMRWLVLSEKQ